jgi:hypothetical protein
MRCDGKMPTEITAEINGGCEELGGIAYDVKRSTVVAWLEKFYEQNGKPEENIAPGTELDVANSELRKILTWARGKRKEVMDRDGKLDVATMTKLTALIGGTEKAIRESKTVKDPAAVDAGNTTKRPDRGILSRIARDEARTSAPSADAESLDGANPEPQPPATPAGDSAAQEDPETSPYETSGVGYPD